MLPVSSSSEAPSPPAESSAVGAAKPVWRSLPLPPGSAAGAVAAPGAHAGPVYRSLAVAPPVAHSGAFGFAAPVKPGLLPGPPALRRAQPQKPGFAAASAASPYKAAPFTTVPSGTDELLVSKTAGLKIAQQQQQPLLTQAPAVPIIFHRSVRHFEVGKATSVSQISGMLAAVAEAQGARIKANNRKGSVKLTKLAPPSAPDGGCSDCVCKLHVYRQDDGSHLVDWTHREGSRTVAAELYRHVLAQMKDHVTGPENSCDQLLVGGKARPCRVYTVPPLPRTSTAAGAAGADAGAAAPAEPAVAAAAVEPLLESAASACVDQQLAACQLLARLTAAGRGDYMAASIVGALYDAQARAAVLALLGCLAAKGGAQATEGGGPREDVRRCIVSTVANMALARAQDGGPLRALLAEAGALAAVRAAVLPGGGAPVEAATFASEAARDALRLVVGDE